MKTNELKELYQKAKMEHEKAHNAFMKEFEDARDLFMKEEYDKTREKLKKGNELVTKSADARETMDQYKKELIKRKAKV